MTTKPMRVRQWPPVASRPGRETTRLLERSLGALEQSFLGALPPSTLKLILRDAFPVSLKAGTRIDFDQDNTASTCLVMEGLLSSFISSNGRQIAVKYNRPGSMFGIVDLVGGAPSWSAGENVEERDEPDTEALATRGFVSLTDSVVLVMSSDVLRTVALSDPVVSWKLAREITRVLYSMVYELSSSVFGSLRQRLAHHLLEVAIWDDQHEALVAKISQQDLADMMGTVREVVTRTMGELRRDGLVERVENGVLVKDAIALHEIVREPRS